MKVKENDADRDGNDESKGGKKDEGKEVDNLHSDKGKDLVRSSDVSIPKKNPSISLPKSLPIPKNIPSITSITFKPNPLLVIEERKEEEEATAETMNLNDSSKRSPLVTAKKESETVGSKVGESSVSRLNEEEGKEGKDVEVQTDNLENSTLTTQPNSLCASMMHPLASRLSQTLLLFLSICLSSALTYFLSLSLSYYLALCLSPPILLSLSQSISLPHNYSISFSLLFYHFLLTVYTFIPISISLFSYAQFHIIVCTLQPSLSRCFSLHLTYFLLSNLFFRALI